jgi:hypothetical protein
VQGRRDRGSDRPSGRKGVGASGRGCAGCDLQRRPERQLLLSPREVRQQPQRCPGATGEGLDGAGARSSRWAKRSISASGSSERCFMGTKSRPRVPSDPAYFAGVFHLSHSPHGGLAVGIGAFGRAIWAQRDPYCLVREADPPEVGIRRRWSFWRTRTPGGLAGPGENGTPTTGVREPRRPLPNGTSGAVTLPDPPGS